MSDSHFSQRSTTWLQNMIRKSLFSALLPKRTNEPENTESTPNTSLHYMLWHGAAQICRNNHPDTLPCLTMADFDATLTIQTQNFLVPGCTVLEYYNSVFGKQDLEDLVGENDYEESEDSESEPEPHERFVITDEFIETASEALSEYLHYKYPTTVQLLNPAMEKHRECLDAIARYVHSTHSACDEFPKCLTTIQGLSKRLGEIEDMVGSTDREELERISSECRSAQAEVLRAAKLIADGSHLVKTLLLWSDGDRSLLPVYLIIRKRHLHFCSKISLSNLPVVRSLCFEILDSADAIQEMLIEMGAEQAEASP